MAGEIKPALDASGNGRKAARSLSRELGYDEDTLRKHWMQLALLLEYEYPLERQVAEEVAVRWLPVLFDKRGCAEPS